MNAFIPALLAVLFAEFGERALALSTTPQRRGLGAAVALLIVAAAIAGALVAPMLPTDAAILMTGVALFFAGVTQLRAPKAASRLLALLASFWGGGSLLLAFALAARFGPAMTIFGALAGLFAAVLLSAIASGAGWKLPTLRRVSAVLLLIAGLFAALGGLRLL